MSSNFYTLLIIPSEKSSVKKIGVSKSVFRGFMWAVLILVPVFVYFACDYILLKNDEAELALLRKETVEQQNQINGLATQINVFAQRMEYLNNFEKKIRIMAGIDGKGRKEQRLGIGGPVNEDERLKSEAAADRNALIAGIHDDVNNLTKTSMTQENNFKELFNFFQQQKLIKAAQPSYWPVRGSVASEFGYRISPFTYDREFHQGIDIAARYGARVVASSDGVVTDASYRSDLGNTVSINNGFGITAYFGHLSRIIVKAGARVKKGDLLGYVGSTGRSTGPHLHYSVSLNGVSVNPRKYLH